MEARAPVLAAVDVRKRFGALAVLDGVRLALNQGEAVGIVGPNGAGKTTLLNVLAGSLRPDAGSILFHGRDITREARPIAAFLASPARIRCLGLSSA